jgi:hypothetical protein
MAMSLGPLTHWGLGAYVPYSDRFLPRECMATAYALMIMLDIMRVEEKDLQWEPADVGLFFFDFGVRNALRAKFLDSVSPWVSPTTILGNNGAMGMFYDAGLHIDTISFGHQNLDCLWSTWTGSRAPGTSAPCC